MVISKPPGPTLKEQMDDLKRQTKSIKRKSNAMQKELNEMTRTLSRTSRNIVLLRRASFSYRVTRHRVLDVYYHYSCILSTGIVSLSADDGKLVMAGYEPDCVTDAFLYENGERGDWRVFFALYGVGHQRVTELLGELHSIHTWVASLLSFTDLDSTKARKTANTLSRPSTATPA